MNIWKYTLANIRFKPLNAIFNVLLLALGIAMILTLSQLNQSLSSRFAQDLKGIDLVVSGKGSPLQIILATVFHIDSPTGNIPLIEAQTLTKNPLIREAIPMALGDNYNGYRIVGTNNAYIQHYDGQLAAGKFYAQPMQAVIGAEVAHKYHLQVGDQIIGAHGLVNSNDLHTDFPYIVVGILAGNGSVLDRLVLTPVESVWHVHEHPDADDPEEVSYKHEHPGNELTALLISYKTPYAAATLPRLISKSSSMQAASPAVEVARLTKLMSTGTDLLNIFGISLLAFAGFGFFVTLYNAINDRQYDIALLRAMGASRSKIFGFVLAEAFTLGIAGTVLGFALAWFFIVLAKQWVMVSKHIALPATGFSEDTIYIAFIALAISLLAGLLPAMCAYRLNITQTLAKA